MQIKPGSYMMLHADLFVRSMNTSLDFYCNKLGFTLVEDAIIDGPIIRSLSGGRYGAARLALIRISSAGAMIELQEMQTNPESPELDDDFVRRRGLISILVADLDAHINRTKSAGLRPSSAVFSLKLPRQGNSRVVFYQDPDGNQLEFLQVSPPPRLIGRD